MGGREPWLLRFITQYYLCFFILKFNGLRFFLCIQIKFHWWFHHFLLCFFLIKKDPGLLIKLNSPSSDEYYIHKMYMNNLKQHNGNKKYPPNNFKMMVQLLFLMENLSTGFCTNCYVFPSSGVMRWTFLLQLYLKLCKSTCNKKCFIYNCVCMLLYLSALCYRVNLFRL